MTEEELYDLSDKELEKLYRDAVHGSSEEPTKEESGETDDSNEVDTEDEEVEVEEANEVEETEEEELDQPKEESNENDSTDNDDDKQTDEEGDAKNVKETSAKPKVYKYKANGKEFEFTEDEIKEQFGRVFAQAMDYTRKMQTIAPYRKMISAMEQEGITQDEMNLLLDARKGNKDALRTLIEKAEVDVADLMLDDEDSSEKYVPNDYGLSEPELQIREVIEKISADPEFAITERVLTTDWDESSRAELANNPALIEKLHIDIANGVFDKVNPMAMKLKVLDGGRLPDIEYYKQAGAQYYAQLRAGQLAQKQDMDRVTAVERAQQQREATKKVAAKRKAAAPTKTRSGQKRSVTDYFEDTDEAFEKWYKELQERM